MLDISLKRQIPCLGLALITHSQIIKVTFQPYQREFGIIEVRSLIKVEARIGGVPLNPTKEKHGPEVYTQVLEAFFLEQKKSQLAYRFVVFKIDTGFKFAAAC